MHSFSETDKLTYRGRVDDGECAEIRSLLQVANLIYTDTLFQFSCFNAADQDDSSIGLIGGQLRIRGSLLRDSVFDPVVNQVCFHRSIFHFLLYLRVVPQVLSLIEEQMKRLEEPIHGLLLVGGFAGSEYLKQRVEVYIFISSIPSKRSLHLYQGNVCVENWGYCKTTRCRHGDVERSSSVWSVKTATRVIRYRTALVYDQSMFFPQFKPYL